MLAIALGIVVAEIGASDAMGQSGPPPGQYDTLVESADIDPWGNGGFSTFGVPALNDSGQAAFYATLVDTEEGTNDDEGIYRASVSSVTGIDREFNSGRLSLTNLSVDPPIDNHGRVAYSGVFWSIFTGVTRKELRFGNGGTPVLITYEGQEVGVDSIETFSSPVLGRNGHIAFSATGDFLADSGPESAVFRTTGSSLQTIAMQKTLHPHGEGNYYSGGFSGLAVNDDAVVSFMANMFDQHGWRMGVYRGLPGLDECLVLRGDPAPGGGEFYDPPDRSTAISNSGQVAFTFDLRYTPGQEADNSGVYRGDSSSVTEIVRKGDSAPDGNGVHAFGTETAVAINSWGNVAFRGCVTDTAEPPSDDNGIFIGSGGAVARIARAGQPVPDGNGRFLNVSAPALNDANVVVFQAVLTDTAGGGNDDLGLYLSDGTEIMQVARKGDTFLGSIITNLEFTDSTGGNGPTRSGLNESTQVAYRADLADGREAIVLFTPDIHWRVAGSGAWATDSNWTLGLTPGEMYDTLIDPSSGVYVSGPSSHTTVKSLTVGATDSGRAVLGLDGNGDLTAVESVGINQRGEIRVGSGRVLIAPELHNTGMLSGDGQVDAQLLNYSDGEVRVGGGESLRFTSATPGSNAGKIAVVDANVEFNAELVNVASSGLIAGENATFSFNGGLSNQGSLALSFGTSRVHGETDNTGYIVVSGKSEATFYDDVTNAGVIQVSGGSTAVFFGELSGNGCSGTGDVFLEGDTRPGFSPGEMSFGGNVAFGPIAGLEIELGGTVGGDDYDRLDVAGVLTPGGTLQVVLIDEFAPDVGDTFNILDWGTLAGAEFDIVKLPALAGRKAWDVSDLYTNGVIGVIGMLDGDTDVDWDVDAVDYDTFVGMFGGPADWRCDFNEDGVIDIADFALQRAHYGEGVSPSEIPEDAATTPEPATLSLLALGGLAVLRRRRWR